MNPDPPPAPPGLLFDVTRLIWRRWAGRHPTGIDRVALAYARHYQTRARAVIQYPRFRRILPAGPSSKLFALLLDGQPNFRRRFVLFAMAHIHRAVKSQPSYGQYYLNVGHTGLNHPGHLTWVQKTGVKPLYLIHDLIPITHPQFCRDGESEKHIARMTVMLRAAHGVIGNSKDTLSILAEFAKNAAMPMPQNIFAHLGTAQMSGSKPNRPASLNKPYFVILATIEGRKNHSLLLDLWQEMIAAGTADIPHLIIIGQRGWQAEHVTRRLDQDTALKPYVTEFSQMGDAEIGAYLRGARALLFPSFAEGYGMPLAEALLIGTPAIASNLAVFREITGDIPEFLDPKDTAGWMDMIRRYATDPSPDRDQQLMRMARLKLPSWPDHFDKIDAWLSALLDADTEAEAGKLS